MQFFGQGGSSKHYRKNEVLAFNCNVCENVTANSHELNWLNNTSMGIVALMLKTSIPELKSNEIFFRCSRVGWVKMSGGPY